MTDDRAVAQPALEIAEGIFCLPSFYDVLGLGKLPVNFFYIKGTKKTLLIDTGASPTAATGIRNLARVADPSSIDYVFLSHMDVDHYGGLAELFKHNPRVRLVGNMTNMLKGSLWQGLPPPQFAVVWPGAQIDLGDRVLTVEPAFIEDGFTFWLVDSKTRTYFSSDAFGAVHFGPAQNFADEMPEAAWSNGFNFWHQVNFTTLPALDRERFRLAVEGLKKRDIQQLASVHGPVIRRDVRRAIEQMRQLPSAAPPPPPQLPPIFSLE